MSNYKMELSSSSPNTTSLRIILYSLISKRLKELYKMNYQVTKNNKENNKLVVKTDLTWLFLPWVPADVLAHV